MAQVQSTVVRQAKAAPPDKFNGVDKKPTIVDWLFAVRKYLRTTKVSEEEQVDIATSFFTDTAMNWWQSVVLGEGEGVYSMSWKEFETKCRKRFLSTDDAEVMFERLQRWRQTGAVTGYISGFQSLAQHVPLDLMNERARVVNFVKGLNVELQKAVKMMQSATLEDAISLANRAGSVDSFVQTPHHTSQRQVSSFHQSLNPLKRMASGNRFTPLLVENIEEVLSEPVTEEAKIMQLDSGDATKELDFSYLNAEQKRLFKENRCFTCKKVGHTSRDCRFAKASTKE